MNSALVSQLRNHFLSSCTRILTTGLVLICYGHLVTPLHGQWTGGPAGPVYYTGGNVGIGTPSPDTISGYTSLTLNGANSGLLSLMANGAIIYRVYGEATNGPAMDSMGIPMRFIVNGERMRIAPNGNIGIGTTSPQHLLHVAGAIGAQEVIVSSTGADYVFSPGYRHKPLAEVASYIQQHHHLPDIPPAREAQTKGFSVGEMQTKLLAKIEELTLHMIRADERNSRLEKQNQELRERITRLETGRGR